MTETQRQKINDLLGALIFYAAHSNELPAKIYGLCITQAKDLVFEAIEKILHEHICKEE